MRTRFLPPSRGRREALGRGLGVLCDDFCLPFAAAVQPWSPETSTHTTHLHAGPLIPILQIRTQRLR